MKGRQIILDHLNGRESAALMVDGRLEDLLIDPETPRPGTIYRAVVDRPVKGQGGVFVKTPDGMGFLRQVRGLSPGQELLVQVTGHAESGKAIPLTAKTLFKSRYTIVTPEAPGFNVSRSIRDEDRRDALLGIAHEIAEAEGFGLILRSSAAEADDDEIAEDIAVTAQMARAVVEDGGQGVETLLEGDSPHREAWREWADPAAIDTQAGGFERHGVLDAIDALETEIVPLAQGASMAVEPTRALVAVDVNTGADTSPAAGTKANFAAARELPRQLRLRGLGGQLTLDLAPMAKKDRRGFESALRAALRADQVETTMVGWTPLGHYELQRKRQRVPLVQLLK